MSINQKSSKNHLLNYLIEQEEIEKLKSVEEDVSEVSSDLELYARKDQPNTFEGDQSFSNKLILSTITLEKSAEGALKSDSSKLMIGDYMLERLAIDDISLHGKATIKGNLYVEGDLNIQGNTTSFNQDEVNVGDSWFNLGVADSVAQDGGLRIKNSAGTILSKFWFDISQNAWISDGHIQLHGNIITNSDDFFLETPGGNSVEYTDIDGKFQFGDGNIVVENSNVGIGTGSPGAKLDVNMQGEAIRIGGNGTGNDNISYISIYDGSNNRVGYIGDGSGGGNDMIVNSDSNDIRLRAGNADVMRIKAGGNVGIGTTNPQSKLHVENGAITIAGMGSNDNVTLMQFTETTNYDEFALKADFSGAGINNKLKFTTDLGGGDLLTLTGGGNVGIGTVAPTYKFQVSGNSYISNQLRVGSNIHRISNNAGIGKFIAQYASSSNAVSGDIIINLGRDSASTMASFIIDVFEYESQGHARIIISGYDYSTDHNWHAYGATQLGGNKDYKIYLDRKSGSRRIIIKGDGTFPYPRVILSEMQTHYSSYYDERFTDNITITIGDSSGGTNVSDLTNYNSHYRSNGATINGDAAIQNSNWFKSKTSSDVSVRLLGINSSSDVYMGGMDSAARHTYIRSNGVNRMVIYEGGEVGILGHGSTPDETINSYNEGLTITGGNQRLVIDVSNATNGGSYIQTRHESTTYPTAQYTLKLNPIGGNVSIGCNDNSVGRSLTIKDGGTIGSKTFSSGFGGSGWAIENSNGDYNQTLDNLTIRKTFKAYEFEIQKIRSGNGSYWFSDGAKIDDITDISSTYWQFHFDPDSGNPFKPGDIIRCQQWTGNSIKYYEMRLSSAEAYCTPDSCYVVKSSYDGNNSHDLPKIGDDIVRTGGSDLDRRGAVYITSNDSNAPYIDVINGLDTPEGTFTTKVRLGKLDGITDPDAGLTGQTNNYGLYSDNVFLKGTIYSQSGNIGGNDITSDGIVSANQRVHFSNLYSRFTVLKNAGSNPSVGPRVQMYYGSDSSWGIWGSTDGTNPIFQLGSTNQIAGWEFLAERFQKVSGYNHLQLFSDVNSYPAIRAYNSSNKVMVNFGNQYWSNGWQNEFGFSLVDNYASAPFVQFTKNTSTNVLTAKIANWDFNSSELFNTIDGRYLILSNSLSGGSSSTLGRRGLTIYNSNDKDCPVGAIKIARFGLLTNENAINSWPSIPNYGFQLLKRTGTSTYKDIFRADRNGAKIAGWNFDETYLWSGTKQTSDAYTSSGMTIGSGSIRSKNFRIDSNGDVYARDAYFEDVFIDGRIATKFTTLSFGTSSPSVTLTPDSNNIRIYFSSNLGAVCVLKNLTITKGSGTWKDGQIFRFIFKSKYRNCVSGQILGSGINIFGADGNTVDFKTLDGSAPPGDHRAALVAVYSSADNALIFF